ncbi:MAG: transcription-repair coupling factor [Proteobacteria bacterium]|nr:transcription-repair coupling factor [Pseudomonadota bacterium]MDA1300829.1 transcription-repair coupling factor [Pseudomonadota bacterium]
MNILPIDDTMIPRQAADRRDWRGLPGASMAIAIASVVETGPGIRLVIASDNSSAEQLRAELQFFLPSMRIATFPDWETLVYDGFSPHQDIISERLTLLNELPHLETAVVIVPANTIMQRLAPRKFILGSSLVLSTGQTFDMSSMRRQLEAAAYRCVDNVYEHGEFAVRGAIMDIFPMGSEVPYRVDLFDDEVDTLRTFDPDTQRSVDAVDEINLLPGREFPLTADAISGFQDRWHERLSSNRDCHIYQDVSTGLSPAGIEYYLPLFFSEMETLFDYLPPDTLVFTCDIEPALRHGWEEAQLRYENLRHDIERPILPPGDLLVSPDDLFAIIKRYPRIELRHDVADKPANNPANNPARKVPYPPFRSLPDVSVNERGQHPLERLSGILSGTKARLLIAAESNGRREIIDDLLTRHHIQAAMVPNWRGFLESSLRLCLTVGAIDRGFYDPDAGIMLISEQQLFGERVLQQRRREKERDNAAELVIKSLTELRTGSPVVHNEHGVGRYLGLETLTIDSEETEFLTLAYQDDARLYVPVSSLHLISRYTGSEEGLAPLHRLGGDTWAKAKRKAAEQIRDVAAELLSIYARREARKGFAYPAPDEAYEQFAATFPFEETPDQQTAIENVIADMVAERSMDRLICGDVGFGKTEVAMRAAFLAVQSGKQVAVLVPTTLLARQHHETFKDRFADWPVNIDSMSRFKTKKEARTIIEQLRSGRLDIVIGTHALIQDGLDFADLGLLIIDEEHRFGVRQKEKLKSLRAEVDILTMTATPIPRTLNMAISNMRDLTIIATPPARRLSIKTFVRLRDEGLIKEAIQRELLRGGQVYYLHNEVKDIEQTADKIQALVPEARVAIGHGQMRERELEQVMSDFYHKKSNVLVCTTIIETGIDIPNANTIIMDRADKFGLAQIHQLRGRVGRSHHQAYAYLLTPHPQSMTADAKKRLDAISEAEDLGAGFILATHDLEIRGAGELLGDEQTGNMQTIGYSLYMEMLDCAVKAIQDGKTPNLDRPLKEGIEVNLRLPALIPSDYLPDVHTRLVLYKRIANAETEDQLRELQVEMIDRFGLLPEPTKTLFRTTMMKLTAEHLGIKKIDAGPSGGRLEFDQDTVIDPGSIVELVQSEPHRYKLSSANQLNFTEAMEPPETRFKKVERLLERLENKRVAIAS